MQPFERDRDRQELCVIQKTR